MKRPRISLLLAPLLFSGVVAAPLFWVSNPTLAAADPVAQLLTEYRQLGADEFSAARGQALWSSQNAGRHCGSCHSGDPSNSGQHQKTRKPIKPLAPSANPKRLTQVKTIKKWLKRNCKWTLGRECTAQEKGDFLLWLSQQ
ncbi:MAG: DUF1924 domain-containing protein [Halopseudomonas sp.]